MKRTANFCTLHDAFPDRTFFVPMYQRQYAWDEPQLEDFWRDLRFLESLEESKSHYLGNLVISEQRGFQDIYDNTLTRCEVIDGQQRLMTIVLLANQLTQRFSNEKQKRQREHYVFWQKANGQEQTRVRPQESERDFFHSLLKGAEVAGYNGAQRRFIAADQFFRERLSSLSDEEVSKLFSHCVCD